MSESHLADVMVPRELSDRLWPDDPHMPPWALAARPTSLPFFPAVGRMQAEARRRTLEQQDFYSDLGIQGGRVRRVISLDASRCPLQAGYWVGVRVSLPSWGVATTLAPPPQQPAVFPCCRCSPCAHSPGAPVLRFLHAQRFPVVPTLYNAWPAAGWAQPVPRYTWRVLRPCSGSPPLIKELVKIHGDKR